MATHGKPELNRKTLAQRAERAEKQKRKNVCEDCGSNTEHPDTNICIECLAENLRDTV